MCILLMQTFAQFIRFKREEKGLLMRQLASMLDIDQAIMSKIESGQRKPSKILIEKMAKIFNLPENELLLHYLSDKIAFEIVEEESAFEVLKVAEEKVEYLRKQK